MGQALDVAFTPHVAVSNAGWIAHAPCPGQASSRDSHSSQGISLLDEEHRIKGYAAGRAQLFKAIGFFDASLGDVDGRSAPC